MVRRDLLRRLEAIEAKRSQVSPLAIWEAQRRLEETGEWPKNPALLEIVRDIRMTLVEMCLVTERGSVEDLNLGFELTPEETAFAQRKWEEVQERLRKKEGAQPIRRKERR